jgi:hypothetical protein
VALPEYKMLPKISPDGEGAVMMVWDGGTDPLLITVDDNCLHMAVAVTTPFVVYYNNIDFDGLFIPQNILDVIPNRPEFHNDHTLSR